MKPEVVQSTGQASSKWRDTPASNVLILGETDEWNVNTGKTNYWLAELHKTTGQGFTMKVDSCARTIAGVHIKNLGEGYATRKFKVYGAKKKNGPWEILIDDGELVDTTLGYAAYLINFPFEKPVELKYLKFELVSYWGGNGGGLQYFAPATSKQH